VGKRDNLLSIQKSAITCPGFLTPSNLEVGADNNHFDYVFSFQSFYKLIFLTLERAGLGLAVASACPDPDFSSISGMMYILYVS
jgi:hypothetical protein